ncbi:unnamed protein product [Hydatigera taeniaeformis]|uniref:Integrin beta n=1 Tax=Hydatigena taeniaeformis TaxID=6205 RepID=A0A0R3WWN4_HYDTA|nr:unnamed protein product [Hydatigera taeniaeformis]
MASDWSRASSGRLLCYIVAEVLTEKDISVIFAIDAKVFPLYEKLAAFLPSAAVGTLTDSSTNIVNLLRENYDKIANRAELLLSYDTDSLEVSTLLRFCLAFPKLS